MFKPRAPRVLWHTKFQSTCICSVRCSSDPSQQLAVQKETIYIYAPELYLSVNAGSDVLTSKLPSSLEEDFLSQYQVRVLNF